MHQTAYKGITTIARLTDFIGGICKWWYVPVEHLDTWPAVDPLTQELKTKPILLAGKSWLGPVRATKGKLGFTEKPKRTTAGLYYEQRVEGVAPGDDRINQQNLPFHRYIILAQPRTGYYWLVIGTPTSPMFYDADYNSGNSWRDTAEADISFKTECRHKAQKVSFTEEEIGGTESLVFSGEFDGGEFE
jgi:hypothetical protein